MTTTARHHQAKRPHDFAHRATLPMALLDEHSAPPRVPVGEAREMPPREGMRQFTDALRRWQERSA